ncbi:hypothetical protein DFH08DRAFT_810370 [Mycena albidolilacea]|uniref:Uncharacterized protein n=1 Tax=Mycena albidolilacea TaxID=1033008 RepID=A0AAD7EPZ3_9AGAR|nr:hypothetical protein DFH08DRAFT_810370 [Mycena albidolilacea]
MSIALGLLALQAAPSHWISQHGRGPALLRAWHQSLCCTADDAKANLTLCDALSSSLSVVTNLLVINAGVLITAVYRFFQQSEAHLPARKIQYYLIFRDSSAGSETPPPWTEVYMLDRGSSSSKISGDEQTVRHVAVFLNSMVCSASVLPVILLLDCPWFIMYMPVPFGFPNQQMDGAIRRYWFAHAAQSLLNVTIGVKGLVTHSTFGDVYRHEADYSPTTSLPRSEDNNHSPVATPHSRAPIEVGDNRERIFVENDVSRVYIVLRKHIQEK